MYRGKSVQGMIILYSRTATDFVNKNIALMPPDQRELKRWSAMFKRACEMEIAMLDIGLQDG